MHYVRALGEMTKEDFEETGGKAANLGEMARRGFNVPPAFCVTGRALEHVLECAGANPRIAAIVSQCDFERYQDIEEKTGEIRAIIAGCAIPAELREQIVGCIDRLRSADGSDPFLAVRSSVSVRESAISSFPGMMDTYHFIKGIDETLESIRRCWASLWTTRAAYRRHQLGIDHRKGVIAPVVQRMVNADVAGVLFTANPINASRDEVVIESVWGLGEGLVSGEGIGDWYVLHKGTPPEIVERRIGRKNIKVTVDRQRGRGRRTYDLTREESEANTLSDEQLVTLAELGMEIERIFGYPQDIEWAYERDELFILQSRRIKGLRD